MSSLQRYAGLWLENLQDTNEGHNKIWRFAFLQGIDDENLIFLNFSVLILTTFYDGGSFVSIPMNYEGADTEIRHG